MSIEYEPGVCNIGPAERRRRYIGGGVGFLGAAIALVVILWVPLPRWTLLLTAIPWFGGLVGVFQGREGFCVNYGLRGLENVREGVGDTRSVEEVDARRRDRRRARRMLLRAGILSGLVATTLYLLVPV